MCPKKSRLRFRRKLTEAAKQDKEFIHLLKGLALGPGQHAVFKIVDVANFMEWPLHESEIILLDWAAAGYLTLKTGKRAMLIELTQRPPGYAPTA